MRTVTVQIGNSDDKLTQKEWSQFVDECHKLIGGFAHEIHFSGCSDSKAPWQNAAWVFEILNGDIAYLAPRLKKLGKAYQQDSIAWTEGETVFL